MPWGNEATRFKKGQSGNPGGKVKKEKSLTGILDQTLEDQKITVNGIEYTGKQALALKLYQLAMTGDVPAIKYIFDRIDGPPKQAVDLIAEVSGSHEIVQIPKPDFLVKK